MKRAFLIVFFIIPISLVVAIVIFLAIGLEPAVNHYKTNLETALSHLIKKQTKSDGKIEISYFPRLELTAHNLIIQTANKPFFSVRQFNLALSPHPWPKETVVISEITLVEPALRIQQGLKETYLVPTQQEQPQPIYLQYLYKFGLILFAGINRQWPPGDFSRLKSLVIQDFRIEQGSFLLLKKSRKTKLQIDDLDLKLKGLHVKNFADLKEDWRALLKKHSITGQASAKALRWDKFNFNNVKLSAKNQKGKVSFTKIMLQSALGKGSGNLVIDFRSPQIGYSINLGLKSVKLGPLLKVFNSDIKAKGKLDAVINVTTQGVKLNTMIKKLSGKVALKGTNLTLSDVDIDDKLKDYQKSQSLGLFDVGAFIVFGPLGWLASKSIDVTNLATQGGGKKKTIVPMLKFDWKIKKGIAQTKDVAFATLKHRVAASGKLDLIKLQYKEVRIATLNNKGCIKFSQVLNGPLNDPEIDSMTFVGKVIVSPLTSLAKGVSSIFSDKCDQFYAGEVPHPKL